MEVYVPEGYVGVCYLVDGEVLVEGGYIKFRLSTRVKDDLTGFEIKEVVFSSFEDATKHVREEDLLKAIRENRPVETQAVVCVRERKL